MSIAVCTLQAEVIQMRQDHTEPVWHFAAKVKGKAANFVKMSSAQEPDVSSLQLLTLHDIVQNVLLAGLADEKKALANDKLEKMLL